MSAETLRRAAALMRERVEALTGTLYWKPPHEAAADSEYIASWGPEVALAVAHLLDTEAAMCEDFIIDEDESPEMLAVARAYLGESE